jgi:hypothetical protein
MMMMMTLLDDHDEKHTNIICSTESKLNVELWGDTDRNGGTRQRCLLRHYATSRKVVGSISDGVTGFFN